MFVLPLQDIRNYPSSRTESVNHPLFSPIPTLTLPRLEESLLDILLKRQRVWGCRDGSMVKRLPLLQSTHTVTYNYAAFLWAL